MDEPQTTSPDGAEEEISLLDLALVLAENIRILVLAPLAAGLVALGYSFTIPPTFTATTRLLPPQQQQSGAAALASQLGALSGLAGAAAGIKNPVDTYMAMIRSWTVADRMVARFKLKEEYKAELDEDARKVLSNLTRVSTGKDGIIVIEVDDHDPKRAADLANAYVDELRNLNQSLAITEAAQRRLFFENQVRRAKDDLTNAEIALRGSGVNEATLKTIPQSALAVVAELRARITVQEVKLASMRGFMADANPEFRQAQQELSALRTQLSKAGESDSSKPGSGTEYVAKYRDFKYHETLFELMVKQYEAARLDEAREGSVIQVIDPARPPERKSKPKKATIAVLTTLGTFFLVALAVFAHQALRNATANPKTAGKLARLRGFLRLHRRA